MNNQIPHLFPMTHCKNKIDTKTSSFISLIGRIKKLCDPDSFRIVLDTGYIDFYIHELKVSWYIPGNYAFFNFGNLFSDEQNVWYSYLTSFNDCITDTSSEDWINKILSIIETSTYKDAVTAAIDTGMHTSIPTVSEIERDPILYSVFKVPTENINDTIAMYAVRSYARSLL